MSKLIVKSVDMICGPAGGHGFRSGHWIARCETGENVRFYGSLPHADGLNEERMINQAQSAIDHGNFELV